MKERKGAPVPPQKKKPRENAPCPSDWETVKKQTLSKQTEYRGKTSQLSRKKKSGLPRGGDREERSPGRKTFPTRGKT